jgi:hypothetical protein
MNALEIDERETAGFDGIASTSIPNRMGGIVTGTLAAMTDDGCTPLVMYAGQPGTAAMAANTTIDLHAVDVGREVVLMFDGGDPDRPIVLGRVRHANENSVGPESPPIDVEVDGERMIVTAKDQLVLKCGKASITLTRAGKVLISGAFVLSHSTGVNRIKGGSIQLN